MDRLSRQKVVDAFNIVLSLINHGIKVVTLKDSGVQILDKSADLGQLILTLSSIHRANSESELKSGRVKEAWRHKKKNAALRPVSQRSPEWLSFNKEKQKFEPIAERVSAIKRIFELADDGIGRHRIVRILNGEGIKSFRSPEQGWQSSSVHKLLANKSLIGFYMPHEIVFDEEGSKKRVPDGEPVPGYYPVVIDEKLFNRVGSRNNGITDAMRGRQGVTLTNLFTGMVFCHWCGAPAALSNKGKWKYLVCSKARRRMGCQPYRSWPYDHIEMLVLASLKEVDFGAILSGINLESQLAEIKNRFASLSSDLNEKRRVLANFNDSLRESNWSLSKTITSNFVAVEKEIAEKEDELEELRKQVVILDKPIEDPATFNRKLLKLYEEMVVAKDQEKYIIRVRLRERISMLVKRIEIKPYSRLDAPENPEKENQKIILIYFRNGLRRVVLPIGAGTKFEIFDKAECTPP